LLTILGVVSGIAVGKTKVKPVYTAKCSVMLAMSLDPSSLTSNSATTDMSLAKIYLPTIMDTVSIPVTIAKANEIYNGDDYIYAGSIGVNGDVSCIFQISYSDSDVYKAKMKLESVISATDIILNEHSVLSAGEANLIPIQSEFTISVSRSITKYVFLGTIIGAALSLFIVLLRFLLDNKVKDPDELEELVGVSVIAFLEK
jgi:capsular polysaccharide biosynthesis protein